MRPDVVESGGMSPFAAPIVAVIALLVAAHLAAEKRALEAVRAATKMAASLGFVLLGLSSGRRGPFEVAVLAGLVLSTTGDACLLSARRPAFLAGLGAFLLAHLAYVAAFAAFAGGGRPLWPGPLVVVAGALVLGWLWPHLGDMRAPVVAYCLAISAMLWLAQGVDRALVAPGAALFYASDLFVARDRFVRPSFANRLLGLPLYYAGQVLLALSL